MLRRLKTHPRLQAVPVVVYTGVENPRIIELCYQAGASAYVVKRPSFEDQVAQLRSLYAFWFSHAALVG